MTALSLYHPLVKTRFLDHGSPLRLPDLRPLSQEWTLSSPHRPRGGIDTNP